MSGGEVKGFHTDDRILAFDLVAGDGLRHIHFAECTPHAVNYLIFDRFNDVEVNLLEGLGIVIDIGFRYTDRMRFQVHFVHDIGDTLVEHDGPIMGFTERLSLSMVSSSFPLQRIRNVGPGIPSS